VFFNIDTWLLNYSPNDLFEKRIGGADLVLINVVKVIFTRFYDVMKKNKVITLKNIRTMLRLDPACITNVWDRPNLQQNSSHYNDNMLLSIMIKKSRQSSSQDDRSKKSTNLITAKEHQFHPSFVAIESILAISTSSPGTSGDINPYAVIDKMGYFRKDKMPWYKEIAPLTKYLVQV
jgi:hypothetical protein